MTSPARKIPVGFTFINNGLDWQGGLNYFRSLFLALQTLPQAAVEPVAFVGAGIDPAGYEFPANVRVVRDSVFDRFGWKWVLNKVMAKAFGVPWITNRLARRHRVEVLSHGTPSCSRTLRSIAWIPDFQHVHLPQFFSEAELRLRDRVFHETLRRSDLVVVSSEAARRDLEQFAPGLAYKARVLHFCAVPPKLDEAVMQEVKARYELDGPYFYLPSQAWAHKNHLTAIRALAQLMPRRAGLRVICSGTLVDHRNPRHVETLRAEIAALGLEARFVLLGNIPYAHIAPLMAQSVAVINPSLFEGWSTPVEEAKALGVPLILSGLDVHREQCQRGEASFFEPLEPADLARRMDEALATWPGLRSIDPQAVLAAHRTRAQEFGRAYERIVDELRVPAGR